MILLNSQGQTCPKICRWTNSIAIELNVAECFLDHDAVSDALQSLIEIIQKQREKRPNTDIKDDN